jgi:phytoene synthase
MTTIPIAPGVGVAYEACERITRDEARNFYYGIRLLPREKRSVLCAVYALARRIDDIGDGDELPTEVKLKQLADLRVALQDAAAGRPDTSDPVLSAVVDAQRRYAIPLGAFGELIDGVEMDIRMDEDGEGSAASPGSVGYATFDDLVTYCRCVAGSVGRLCLGVFGSRADPAAEHYADALGIALQQTNILRDIREDLTNGRVYLPTDELQQFDVRLELDGAGRLADPDGNLAAYIRFAAERAQRWYAEGLRLVPLLDRRSAACCTAMSGIYSSLLRRIGTQPELVYDRRLSLSGREKALVAARALAGRAA